MRIDNIIYIGGTMDNIDHKAQLSADEIKAVINTRAKDKGLEVSNIVIGENITFNGTINGKFNSDFSCEIGIRGVKDHKLTLELYNLKIEKLGFLKGTANIFIKGLLNKLGNDNVIMKGNNIVFNIKELQKELQKGVPKIEVAIDNVYIKDRLLNIEGKKLKKIFVL